VGSDKDNAIHWHQMSSVWAPSPRLGHSAVWTGDAMIVWGGQDTACCLANTGGRYDPVSDSWTPTETSGAPSARRWHVAVWTGSDMIVWGGTQDGSGGRYNPATDTWAPISIQGAPTPSSNYSAVWTGTEMIVWGGYSRIGARYNPGTDTWTAITSVGAPSQREAFSLVWTGSEMIAWGGYAGFAGSDLNSGGRYNPAGDLWQPVTTLSAPTARHWHSAAWTGQEMIVWGGVDSLVGLFQNGPGVASGGRYDPVRDAWTPTSVTTAPMGRSLQSAVWTPLGMVVWAGLDSSNTLTRTGGRYEPLSDAWHGLRTTDAPDGRRYHTAIWTGHEMIVWGGADDGPRVSERTEYGYPLNSGGRMTLQR
jgi:hypothetical protein